MRPISQAQFASRHKGVVFTFQRQCIKSGLWPTEINFRHSCQLVRFAHRWLLAFILVVSGSFPCPAQEPGRPTGSILGDWKIEPLPKSETGGYVGCLVLPTGELFIADVRRLLVRSPWAKEGWETAWEAPLDELIDGIRLDTKESPGGLVVETTKQLFAVSWETSTSITNPWEVMRYRFRSRVIKGSGGRTEVIEQNMKVSDIERKYRL